MKNKLKIPIVALTIIYRTDSGEDDSTTSYNPKIYNKKMLCKLDFVAHLYCIEIGDLWWPAYAKFLEAGIDSVKSDDDQYHLNEIMTLKSDSFLVEYEFDSTANEVVPKYATVDRKQIRK